VSQDFSYIPGTVSGDHHISVDIPGVGSLSDIVFSLLPGDPLSISHRVDTDRIVFSLRDRYDNIASLSTLTGSLVYNAETPKDVIFDRGTLSIPIKSGYYRIVSPGIRDFAITYRDDAGPHSIRGIDTYTTHISGPADTLHFAPDYNARYTVLA
jgi:hypothetical protein